MAVAWGKILAAASAASVSLGISLSQGSAGGVENGCLVLRFPAKSARAHGIVDNPEHREAIEAAMAQVASNLKTFRAELLEDDASGGGPEGLSGALHSSRVSPEDAEEALRDPHVANVVDIFKGRIIEIKHDA